MIRVLVLAIVLAPRAASAQECAADDSLASAASALLDTPVTSHELVQAIRAAGSDAPVVEALVIRDGDRDRRARFLARVEERRGAPLACGEARRGLTWIVLAAPRLGGLELVDDASVRVAHDPRFRDPRVYATDASGALFSRAVQAGDVVHLPSDLVPPIRVQLIADGPSGPQPIAERRIGHGVERVIVASDEPLDARLAELRDAEGLGALRANRLLARVAAAHAGDVCAGGPVGHLGDGGDPRERLARAGIRARHVGEVVARAEREGDAYAAALRSPSHRAALIDPRFTDVGIASVRAGDDACLVVLLAAWPRAVPY